MTPFAADILDLRPLLMERRKLSAIWAHGVSRFALRDVEVEIDPTARDAFPNTVEFSVCPGLSIQGFRDLTRP